MTAGLSRRRKEPPVESPLTAWQRSREPVEEVVVEEVLEFDELLGDSVQAHGPSQPTGWHGPQAPEGLPRVFGGGSGCVHVVGLHGGSGASTLTRLLGEDLAVDAGRKVPMGSNCVVLLVARTHAAGLEMVRGAGQAWTAHQLDDIQLMGLVLVDDGPHMPREQQRAVKALLRVLPATWRLQWHEPWRVTTDPTTTELPARIRRTVKEVRDRGASLVTPTVGITKEKS